MIARLQALAARARATAARTVAAYRNARKAAVYVAQVAAQLVALGVLHGTALHIAQGVLAVAGAVGLYQATNAPKAPSLLDGQ